MAKSCVNETDIEAYERDGVVCLRGVFRDWVETIQAGIETNIREPGPYASESTTSDEAGSFFDDYCNWERIPEFVDVIRNSPAAQIAAEITRSKTAQFFHDHVLVKEPGTAKPTPWHQDLPYYFVEGSQMVSFWVPVDPVKDATLRLIKGSHQWDKLVLPVKWFDNAGFYEDTSDYLPIPDPDAEPDKYQVLEWEMEPGDAVLFDYRTVHGGRGNLAGSRRRAFSMRWLGDDAQYCERPGRTSPPYPGHNMKPGEKLREDWFPVIWNGAET